MRTAVLALSLPGGSLGVRFRDGLTGALLVDDGTAVRERGDEGLACEVVDRAGKPARCLVDAGKRVIGEERVGAALLTELGP